MRTINGLKVRQELREWLRRLHDEVNVTGVGATVIPRMELVG